MRMESARNVVERYMRAMPGDPDTLATLRHPDFVVEYPQSGELIRGHDNWQRAHARYREVRSATHHVTGGEDNWVLTPGWVGFTATRIVGAGDAFTVEAIATYPGGDTYHVITILELRDRLVYRSRTYFAPPFEAPEWRARWVEGEAATNGADRGVDGPRSAEMA